MVPDKKFVSSIFFLLLLSLEHNLILSFSITPITTSKAAPKTTTTASPFGTPNNQNLPSLRQHFVVPSMSSNENDIEKEGVEIPSKETLDELLNVAIKASRAAGDVIYMNIGAEVTKTKANSRDLLTTIDPMCEMIIKDKVHEKFPTHDFLGEEDVPPGKEASAAALKAKLNDPDSSDYLWIVDPIDGTSNFVHGMPLCMPSIAVAYKGEVVVAVIFDPHRNEVFASQKGQGAYLNGERMKVGEQETLSDAIVAMGSPPAEESMEMSLKAIQVLMPRVRTIRMLGSAALMLAWVACGRLTAYWEYDLSSWDVAAGYLIIKEAGGQFTNLKGEEWDLSERKIVASNGHIQGELLEVLEEAKVV